MFIAGVASVVGVAIIYTSETNGQFLGGKMVNATGLGMGKLLLIRHEFCCRY